jgi:NhaA family Na+:H+ antiporter
VVLLLAAAVALIWANSPGSESYARLWQTPLRIGVGAFTFERSLAWAVNDGLMVLFFFVVGMEIRREIHCGELSDLRRAALPAAAALGGMIAPALLYLLLAGSPETRPGWGVPMATDIAFAVGVLALLGPRVPAALRVLLLALAVLDDLGAILIIALFYSAGVSGYGLLLGGLGVAGIFGLQFFGVRRKAAYIVPALVAWAGVYAAGIHPTIAGVIVGLVTPVRTWLGPEGFVRGARIELDHLARTEPDSLSAHELAETLRHIDAARREAMSPAESLIEALHPLVAFFIMPVFALANAGISLSGLRLDAASTAITAGVAAGLVLGKPLGILLFSCVLLKLRIAALPRGLSSRHLVVLGLVAGIGFTMSLFIAQLGFTEDRFLSAAKLGVLVASAGAAVLGLGAGRVLLRATGEPEGATRTADGAESAPRA